ncbi:MAG TPA: 2Fe-2S iron-sulfur cluster-binding protein [Vicinamibacteria bacterium]|nr:2Fe-2S iron-sulfur cluster-binding protein [Vicinamibacteria bacterium]
MTATEVQIPGEVIPIFFNGREILLEPTGRFAGGALLEASGKPGNLPRPGELPYLFCGNGACRDCNLHVDGVDDVASCQLPLSPRMSFRSGEGAGEENALSRNLRGLDRGAGETLEIEVAVVGAGTAGASATLACRRSGLETDLFDSRADRGSPRPICVRDGRLFVADEGFLREVRASVVILATGSRQGEPQLSLAKSLGCRTIYDRELRYERLVLDEDGRTSVEGVFAAGDGARLGTESDAESSGRRAGEAAAAS